jgi:hypothetical protein
MNANEITCELVDNSDLDTRYLAGRLSAEEAEAFEAHFFGCERCWGLVQQGLEVQSAFGAHTAPSGLRSDPPRSRTRTPARWWGLAAAAGIVLAAVGVWQSGHQSESRQPQDVLRGDGTPLMVNTAASSTALRASWSRLPEADVYRVRLHAVDGSLAFEREVSDTSLSVPMDSIASGSPNAEMFWQVQALDRLRHPIARSALTKAVSPDSQP